MAKNGKRISVITLAILVVGGAGVIYRMVIGSLEAQRMARIKAHEAETRNHALEQPVIATAENRKHMEYVVAQRVKLAVLQAQLTMAMKGDGVDKIAQTQAIRDEIMKAVKETTTFLNSQRVGNSTTPSLQGPQGPPHP